MKCKIKMVKSKFFSAVIVLSGILSVGALALAGVSAQEAEQLKTTLTPFGAERAGNKDGTIPAWTGGLTAVPKGYDAKKFKKRPDLFPNEKPLFTITAQNMGQYADKLTDGDKALFKTYPEYRMNIYPTHRTAAAPQWVYDNTSKNATRGKLNGDVPEGVYGGIPFPIPKSGEEAIWNHTLSWNGGAFSAPTGFYLLTADGKSSLLSKQSYVVVRNDYYLKDGSPEKWDGYYKKSTLLMAAPPVRAGEGSTVWANKKAANDAGWTYLPGQRRVRQLPSPCCDIPNPSTSGLAGFDEIANWFGRTDRYDWKIVGKKEIYIGYNENKWSHAPKDKDVITGHIANPEWRRYELHRVWVIEAKLRAGQRHVHPKAVFYLDEDTWQAVSAERYDGNGKLWKFSSLIMMTAPEVPIVLTNACSVNYDLVAKQAILAAVNEASSDIKFLDPKSVPLSNYTPEALQSMGVR